MELEKVTAEIRPRTQWEAIDLGVRLVSEHAISLIKGWMASVYPCGLLIVALCYQSPLWGLFLVWWLKPVWERVALHPLSRSLFGEHPTWRETMKVLPGELKKNKDLVLLGLVLTALGWWSHSGSDDEGGGGKSAFATLYWLVVIGLLFYRSGLNRSLVLPIRYLEGLGGSRYRTRCQTLSYRSSGAASGLTFICLLMEILLWASQIYFVLLMTPQGVGVNDGVTVEAFFDREFDLIPLWVWGVFAIFYLNAMSVVAWFYTGGGFGLYVNTRTWTEGWDIELKFKGLGQRLGLLVLALTCFAGGSSLEANEDARRVLEDDDFKVETRGVYETKKAEEKNEDKDESSSTSRSSMNGELFAGIGSGLFWVIAAVVIALVGWLVVANLHVFRGSGAVAAGETKKKIKTVAGMNVEPENLPEHLVESARKLWEAGHCKEALGLLYRGAISSLVTRQMVEIEESDTEMDCLRRVSSRGEVVHASYFQTLTEAWISEAYARRTPDARTVEGLWGNWPFGKGGQS